MTEKERQLHFALLNERWVSRRYKKAAEDLAKLLSCFLELRPSESTPEGAGGSAGDITGDSAGASLEREKAR